MSFLDEPEVPAGQRIVVEGRLRYDDISQDGRMTLMGLPHSFGLAVWQSLLSKHPVIRPLSRSGVVPILTKLVMEGGEGPLSVRKPIEIHGRYQLAHTVDEKGRPSRILLRMWTRLYAPRSRTVGVPPPGAGERILVGRTHAEHVFTRLFAPPGQRKVRALEVPGAPLVPEPRLDWVAPERFVEPPAGATPLDAAPHPDDAEVVFGLVHTDSNQHVNSLVYPRLVEDAALRALARHGIPGPVLGRRVEVGYGKPCFAGDRLRIHLSAFRIGEGWGVAGAFLKDGAARPHVTVRLTLTA